MTRDTDREEKAQEKDREEKEREAKERTERQKKSLYIACSRYLNVPLPCVDKVEGKFAQAHLIGYDVHLVPAQKFDPPQPKMAIFLGPRETIASFLERWAPKAEDKRFDPEARKPKDVVI